MGVHSRFRWKKGSNEYRITLRRSLKRVFTSRKPPKYRPFMAKKPSPSPSSRRGFLRALMMDLPPKSAEDLQDERKRVQRASVLALKYAKNDKNLTRIGVGTPDSIGEQLFCVNVSGDDPEGARCYIELQVDTLNDLVGEVVSDESDEGKSDS